MLHSPPRNSVHRAAFSRLRRRKSSTLPSLPRPRLQCISLPRSHRCRRHRHRSRLPRACRMSLTSRLWFRQNSTPARWEACENNREPSYDSQEDRGPMGLLKRLTAGLTRREDDTARLEPAQPREPAMRPVEQRRPLSQDASIYAPRRGQLDEQGRVQPQARQASEDDQLEIPAFLRRQAN